MNTQRQDPWVQLCARLGMNPTPTTKTIKTTISQDGAVTIPRDAIFTPKGDGERTQHLTSMAGQLLAAGCTLGVVESACLAWNSTCTPPLDVSKVIDTCRSIEQGDRLKHPERARKRDQLAGQPLQPLFDPAEARIGPFLAAKPPPMRWLLSDFLPMGITCGIVSPGGVGKSQFLMQLAYSIATGIPLAGHWKVGESGSVLMLCAEDGANEIHRRVHKIHGQAGSALSPTQQSQLRDRLLVRSTIGQDTLLTASEGRGEVTRTTWPERLVMTVQAIPDLKLIIMDPASRFRGGEENSNEDGTRFIEALEYISQCTGATVLIAHHANKSVHSSQDGANQSHARGASSLVDGLRWQLALTTIGKQNGKHYRDQLLANPGHYLEAALVKTNYTAPQEPVLLRREDDGYLQGVTAVAAHTGPSPALMQLLSLVANAKQPLTAKSIEQFYCGPGKPIAMAQKAARELIREARDSGLINGHGRQPVKINQTGLALLMGHQKAPVQVAGGHSAATPRTAKK